MVKLYVGKFSSQNPEQIEKKFYSAGDKGSPWYGGVEPGDYVFPVYEGRVLGLWQAEQYTQMANTVNAADSGVLTFQVIREYEGVSLRNEFTRYRHFRHDLNLVNKVSKSVKNLGFIPIQTSESCPMPQDIDFKGGVVGIYIAFESTAVSYKEGDIRVLLDSKDQLNIMEIQRFQEGEFSKYEEFDKLYRDRNKDDGYYTLLQLQEYSKIDNAPKKRKFLGELIEELRGSGFYKITDIIKLYDHVLVGRKRSASSGKSEVEEDELITAVSEDIIEDDSEYAKFAKLLSFNPNLILYGPPGTGKTYATNNIIHAYEKLNGSGSGFHRAHTEGRVKYVTFHQAYSYEEFIEGIRPVLHEDGAGVGYTLSNGLFKEFCLYAGKEYLKTTDNATYIDKIDQGSCVWKISLGERSKAEVFNECIAKGEIRIDFLNEIDLSNLGYEEILDLLEPSKFGDKPTQNAKTIQDFTSEMSVGDIVMVYNSPDTVRQIGIVDSDYIYDKQPKYSHMRKVKWLLPDTEPVSIRPYNGGKALAMRTVYQLTSITVDDVVKMVNERLKQTDATADQKCIRPYYIVIDEINRGNISKIFGELITLIEQDKRGMEVNLPYSKKPFKVPANIIIIGTMNTADRSIAAIDTALRRRFIFVEIEPESKVLADKCNPIVNDRVDLVKLLDALNARILEKYDRDHRIGHAYFMGVDTLTGLYQAWYYKILPLLSEYFYGDITTLKTIVGDQFYDSYGNPKFLSISSANGILSEFEGQLVSIYQG